MHHGSRQVGIEMQFCVTASNGKKLTSICAANSFPLGKTSRLRAFLPQQMNLFKNFSKNTDMFTWAKWDKMIIKTLLITQMLLDIVFYTSSCNFANSNFIPLNITFSIFLANTQ